jgi:hypothetical protein
MPVFHFFDCMITYTLLCFTQVLFKEANMILRYNINNLYITKPCLVYLLLYL